MSAVGDLDPVASARRADRLERLVGGLSRGVAVPCDLGLPEQLERPVAAALEAFSPVDVLVNNAGMSFTGAAEEEAADTFRTVLDINLLAPFVLAQRVARHAIAHRQRASIVKVASVLGMVGLGRIPQAGYAASKGGLVNLTRELAAQWARKGIRLNALAPGWFESEMTAGLFAGEGGQAFIRRGAPMGRAGAPHELDGALLFLASGASSYVTGQVLAVYGGWTAV